MVVRPGRRGVGGRLVAAFECGARAGTAILGDLSKLLYVLIKVSTEREIIAVDLRHFADAHSLEAILKNVICRR